jgi:hypothetical protein
MAYNQKEHPTACKSLIGHVINIILEFRHGLIVIDYQAHAVDQDGVMHEAYVMRTAAVPSIKRAAWFKRGSRKRACEMSLTFDTQSIFTERPDLQLIDSLESIA